MKIDKLYTTQSESWALHWQTEHDLVHRDALVIGHMTGKMRGGEQG